MKHIVTSTVGWFTLAFLLALSPQIAGCNTDPKSELSPSPKQDASVTKPQTSVAIDTQNKPIVVEAEPSQKEEPVVSSDAHKETQNKSPEVRRLVIASDVDDREPVGLEQGSVDQPVVAFVEMRNLGAEDSKIVVTFEHESGKKVGFIELGIPKESSRYRTWGRTHNIRDAGKWTAIVATEDGHELARESFSVSG